MRIRLAIARGFLAATILAAPAVGLAQSAAPAAPPVRQGFREPDPIAFENHEGFRPLFDGSTLTGWDGEAKYWRVEGGAIVGEFTQAKPVGNSYIVYKGLTARNFDLKLEIKVENGGGSGIQYRSQTGVPWRNPERDGEVYFNLSRMLTGPQADFWYPTRPATSAFTGQFYSENTGRGVEAWRGQVVETQAGGAHRLLGLFGDRSELGGWVRINDWNQYTIIARNGVLIHILNGHVMAVLVDDDPASSNNQAGLFGLTGKLSLEGFRSQHLREDAGLERGFIRVSRPMGPPTPRAANVQSIALRPQAGRLTSARPLWPRAPRSKTKARGSHDPHL